MGPIILDSTVAAEVDALLAEKLAVFKGLVRRDTPGQTVHVRVEVGPDKVCAKVAVIVSIVSGAIDSFSEGGGLPERLGGSIVVYYRMR